MHTRILSSRQHHPRRQGYTLVELLIVISIIVILLAMTVTAVNFNTDAERVRGGAAQVQSFLAGARDRAIYAKEARGVRFFLDPVNNRAVTTMVYIDPAEYWSDGVIQLQRMDSDGDGRTNPTADTDGDGTAENYGDNVVVVAGSGTAWWELKRRGMLFDGMRIRIPKGPTGNWYPIRTSLIDITAGPTATQRLILSIPYRDPGDTPREQAKAFESGGPEDYELELPPRILPMNPVILPQGTVIDLDGSRLPDAWRPNVPVAGAQGSGNLLYSQFMDIVFSPRGNVVGSAASAGVIHFYVCDNDDSVTLKEEFTKSLVDHVSAPASPPTLRYAANGQDLPIAKVYTFNEGIRSIRFVPADEIDSDNVSWLTGYNDEPYLTKDRRIVSVFTQTGAISVHPVNPTDSGPDGLADDPYFFAETGETAN